MIAALAVAAVVGRNAQPDSLAALHALTPALLLAGGALAATAGGPQARHIAHTSLPLDLALLLVLVIVGINGHALFVRRPADAAAWTAYASPEALAAREIGKLTPTHTIYLADVWLDDPTIRFLARGLSEPRRLDPATTLPLPHDESFAYFAPGSQEVVAEDLERLYEDGEIDRYRSPLDENDRRRAVVPGVGQGRRRGARRHPPRDPERALTHQPVHAPGLQGGLAGRRRVGPPVLAGPVRGRLRGRARASTACGWTLRPARPLR